MTARDLARPLETGVVLGVLTVVLVITGVVLSPTIAAWYPPLSDARADLANALYVTHVVAGTTFAAYVAWHLLPWARAFGAKPGLGPWMRAASYALLAVAALEILTGIVLWSHWYGLVGKPQAVLLHLLGTALIVLPFVAHLVRGLGVWTVRRRAALAALSAADAQGRGDAARAAQAVVSRRRFVRLLAVAAAAAALAGVVGRFAREQLQGWRLNSVGDTPRLTKQDWRLKVGGHVGREIEITFDQLLAMPRRTLTFTHRCVEGWTYTNEFTGVPLRHVLEAAGGLRPTAKQLIFRSPEVSKQRWGRGLRYTTNFPAEDGLHDDVLLVFRVAGEDLPPEHGFPVRLMTPRKWGYKACKWLTAIEATDDATYRGYWERFGYHNDGDWPGPIFDETRRRA